MHILLLLGFIVLYIVCHRKCVSYILLIPLPPPTNFLFLLAYGYTIILLIISQCLFYVYINISTVTTFPFLSSFPSIPRTDHCFVGLLTHFLFVRVLGVLEGHNVLVWFSCFVCQFLSIVTHSLKYYTAIIV